MVMKGNLIYTAPWVFPIGSPAIFDGAIVMNSEQIVKVGSRKKVLREYSSCKLIELQGIAMPPLVNGHIHLELSYLKTPERPAPGTTMVDWIDNLLQKRLVKVNDDTIAKSMHDTVIDQFNTGVVLMADVGNIPSTMFSFRKNYPEILSILELLGPTRKRTEVAINDLEFSSNDRCISPHAPYSTSAHLIASLKKRADQFSHVYSIHLAESCEEIEFLCNRSGVFRSFLEERESWEPDMLGGGQYVGAVDYLNNLGVLNDKTLCVHCVHIEEKEISLLSQKEVKVCLCPGSNEFLGVGRAPLEKMLSYNILPAIGTDSYASNESLDLWREMQILRRNNPQVNSSTILKMATSGGAKALQRGQDYGELAPGKKPLFLEILLDNPVKKLKRDVLDELTLAGRPQRINWITISEN